MIKWILAQVKNPDMDMHEDNIDYFLTKISQLAPELAKAG